MIRKILPVFVCMLCASIFPSQVWAQKSLAKTLKMLVKEAGGETVVKAGGQSLPASVAAAATGKMAVSNSLQAPAVAAVAAPAAGVGTAAVFSPDKMFSGLGTVSDLDGLAARIGYEVSNSVHASLAGKLDEICAGAEKMDKVSAQDFKQLEQWFDFIKNNTDALILASGNDGKVAYAKGLVQWRIEQNLAQQVSALYKAAREYTGIYWHYPETGTPLRARLDETLARYQDRKGEFWELAELDNVRKMQEFLDSGKEAADLSDDLGGFSFLFPVWGVELFYENTGRLPAWNSPVASERALYEMFDRTMVFQTIGAPTAKFYERTGKHKYRVILRSKNASEAVVAVPEEIMVAYVESVEERWAAFMQEHHRMPYANSFAYDLAVDPVTGELSEETMLYLALNRVGKYVWEDPIPFDGPAS